MNGEYVTARELLARGYDSDPRRLDAVRIAALRGADVDAFVDAETGDAFVTVSKGAYDDAAHPLAFGAYMRRHGLDELDTGDDTGAAYIATFHRAVR